MLVAFTTGDPDGNGIDDTYGLGISNFTGSWDIMQIWFGAPNGWGLTEDDELIPVHMTPEYDEALAWFRKIYSEGLVNPDFNEYPSGEWDNLLRGGIAGASADVTDRFRRNQEYFNNNSIPAETRIVGYFTGAHGPRTYPTQGYADLLAISTQKAKTEEDMLKVMDFINKMSDAEMLNLAEWGYEGDDYYFDEELGYYVRYTAEEKTANGFPTTDFRNGFNQMLSYFISPEQNALRIYGEPLSELRQMEADVQADNLLHAVPNYGASYISETYTASGTELDAIIADARIDYIIGTIDDVGLQEAKNQWLRSGGEDVIKEMNELYKASKEAE
jgi:putative aldouronate transport system substrate-binding protein